MTEVRFAPAGPLRGGLTPPPDKSISHRAAIIGAMGEGESLVTRYLNAADTRSTLDAVRRLGAEVEEHTWDDAAVNLRVTGPGRHGANDADLDVGNAGTLLRILPGWLAGMGRGVWNLDGDESIRRRPVDRIAEPLQLMGASIECRHGFLPPLQIKGAELAGIEYRLPIASAQVKSCVLLAALSAAGKTTVFEDELTRDHTERMLAAAGADIDSEILGTSSDAPAREIQVRPGGALGPLDLAIPGDFSSAAFLIVAAVLVPGSEVQLRGVGANPTRTGLLAVLDRMGADIEVEHVEEQGGEPVADIVVRASALQATEVGNTEVPSLIDELLLVGLLGAFAEGDTVVSGAAELRHKESDRLAAVVHGLGGLGAEIEDHRDGFVVHGTGGIRGGWLDAQGDHRLAMLGAVAGLASREGVTVEGVEAAAVSYPGFEADLGSLLAS